MKKFLLSLLFAASVSAAPNYVGHLKEFEGFHNRVYICSQGFRTVGLGTNLDARKLNYKVGQFIDNKTLMNWAVQDIRTNELICRKYVKDFDKLPDNVRELCLGLAYNVGEGGFIKFKNFRRELGARNYKGAANELQNSKWFKQVKGRGVKYVNTLREII